MLACMITPGAIGPGVRHSWPRSRYCRAPGGMVLQHAYGREAKGAGAASPCAVPRPQVGRDEEAGFRASDVVSRFRYRRNS